jgi:hypothetical protein
LADGILIALGVALIEGKIIYLIAKLIKDLFFSLVEFFDELVL